MKIVLQKFIAESGFCSRRQAEVLIREGRVAVNGERAVLGARVDAEDTVKIGNQRIGSSSEKIYVKLNKPKGYTCTNRSFANEQNVFELLPVETHNYASLHIVGRLDKDSRGLVLLTNDGALTQKMTHPSFQHEKKYGTTINNSQLTINQADEIIKIFKKGVDIGGDEGMVRAKDVRYMGKGMFVITLTEGKKRQIRRMFGSIGFDVVDLVRTSIGSLELGDLKTGESIFLDKSEINLLLK